MKCTCGSNVTITEKNFAIIDGKGIVVCERCKRVHDETDFDEREIEKAYWATDEKNKKVAD